MIRHAAIRSLLLLGGGLSALLAVSDAGAITREETIVRAKAYCYHPWHASSANLTASCSSSYQSVYVPGDYMGLPYDWGGYMTLFEFDQQIASGYGAGSYPEDGVLSCTSGVDCSGFVSKCWDSGHWTTSTVHQTSSTITQQQLLPGDIINQSGYHMALFSHTLGNGEPVFYQALGYNAQITMPGWSWTQGYTPRRYNSISGTTAGNPLGTTSNPIVIGSLPYTDQRNTTQSASDVLDGCGASPNTNESGREFIYQVNITQPGTLNVSVQDDVGVDIDVHVYTSMNTNDCVARHDSALSYPVDCGTYYVVADTYKGATEYAGAYTLNVSLTPSTQACGSGPPSYQFEGQMGDDCAYPGNQNLPFCNPNLGATTCIYTSSDSFCSKACSANSDCTELSGGCCADIGNQEFYCLPGSLCGGPDPGVDTGEGAGPQGDPGEGELGGAGGVDGAGSGGNPSSGAGSNASSDSGDDSEESGGCNLGGSPRDGSDWLWLMGLALALGIRRRR